MEGPADERFDESPICRVSQSPGRQGFTLFWPIRGLKNGAHLSSDDGTGPLSSQLVLSCHWPYLRSTKNSCSVTWIDRLLKFLLPRKAL